MNLRKKRFSINSRSDNKRNLVAPASNSMTVGGIAANFDTARPTVSKHLQILTERELLKQEQNGRGNVLPY